MSFEPDDIVATMTREELVLYRGLGGTLSAVQQRRLLGRTMRALDWHVPPAFPGVVAPAADVIDLDRRVADARRALCPPLPAAPPPPRTPAAVPGKRPTVPVGAPPQPRPDRRPGEIEIVCVEDPRVRYRSVRAAAAALGVHASWLGKLMRRGRPVGGRHWQPRLTEVERRMAC